MGQLGPVFSRVAHQALKFARPAAPFRSVSLGAPAFVGRLPMTLDAPIESAPAVDPIVRPGPLAWIWYAIGGRGPGSNSSSGPFLITCPTLALRALSPLLS